MASRLLQRRIGAILRQLREDQGWSRSYASGVLRTTEAKLKNHENGEVTTVEPGLVENWAQKLLAPPEIAAEIAEMAQLTRGDVTRWDIGVRPWFGEFVALEPTATEIDSYQGESISGLLQVPGYMEANARVSALLTPGESDRVIAVRQNRQPAVFQRPGGSPKIRIIMHETALERIRHEPYFEEQLQRIREVDALPNVQIYILPHSVGLHASMGFTYTLMRFDDTPDPEVVYVEHPGGAYLESKREILASYRKVLIATLDDCLIFARSKYGNQPVA